MGGWTKSSYNGDGGCVEMSWQKSSFSGSAGNCIEVANIKDEVLLRNSNHHNRGILTFSQDAVSSWIAGVKSSEFDYLT